MKLSRLWMILTLNCEHASRLMSDACDGPIEPSERLAMRLHTACCKPCRRFRRQLGVIERACEALANAWRGRPETHDSGPRLSAEAADRIDAALRTARASDLG
ncbi:hypothetical protein Mal64_22630 [Pseudobythopirellula maris]|uniref:Putative zinc-finger domain-containing protein n=1 Tax=Pseudobythopirellula maris TaxID=2527991 RepID=A0A5C5ZNW5_9BACT|nr:zf-HC2 domain-containing protein [Pseudobythopirellula maris]TWT88775.1 hypothetical protein Mal64_22630 [Pseudobythopirellula maris]